MTAGARDGSGNENTGTIVGAKPAAGKQAQALSFAFRRSRSGGTFVRHKWRQDIPLFARAMIKAANILFVAGPPDLIDEEGHISAASESRPAGRPLNWPNKTRL